MLHQNIYIYVSSSIYFSFCFSTSDHSVLITATLYVAAVARRPGESLVIEEIMVAPPMPREVRIRIICSSICHIDLTFSDMQVSFFIHSFINNLFVSDIFLVDL